MLRMSKYRFIFSLAIILVVFPSSILKADISESDEREINKFRLTEQNFAQFAQGTKNLIAALQKNPELARDFSRIKAGEERLDAVVRSFNSIPDAKKAVLDSGMTTRDFVLFEYAILYGAAGHLMLQSGAELPAGYSKENVEFYRTHEAEFMKLQPDFKMLEKLTSDELDSDEDSVEDEADEDDEEDENNL